MCEYCGLPTKTLKVNTNIKDDKLFVIIARGNNKHELIVNTQNGVLGIEIDKCPKCGKDLNN